ncbi:hypothetical protein ALO94_200076 [Pseudomonas syringae pv. spinaceae]|uniref:Uncharacterized protein n=1 Tax=Pseudomonas syringae pv. spinaceae TaxID=264459 RepID=A0A0Q0A1J9_PSESX|nr:hypothetical protein ALO94_200076 [Pseudomonas syringae pv. spinaceae]
MNRPRIAAQFAPVLDFAAENARQLQRVQLPQRVARMQDHGNAIDSNDLLANSAFQVAETA